MTWLQVTALTVLAVSTVGLVLIFWCAITAPADSDDDASTDQQAADSIRAEWEQQEEATRPHGGGLAVNARRYPRTMTEAFGPYTSNELHPMPEPRARRAQDLALYICSALALAVLAALYILER